MDIIMLLHGTTYDDTKSEESAKNMPNLINVTEKLNTYFLVSVAYKETNMAIGDDVLESEQVFVTLKNNRDFQNFKTRKIYPF